MVRLVTIRGTSQEMVHPSVSMAVSLSEERGVDATLLCEGVEGDVGYSSRRFRENADSRDDILR